MVSAGLVFLFTVLSRIGVGLSVCQERTARKTLVYGTDGTVVMKSLLGSQDLVFELYVNAFYLYIFYMITNKMIE